MHSEYQILTHLTRNDQTSQRKIATGVDLSVGTVNLLLKKMVRKGLVKLERVDGRTLRYIVTPHGMAEKTRLVYRYLVHSYRQIAKINQALEKAVAREAVRRGAAPWVVFYGPPDEVLEILKIAAATLDLDYSVASGPDSLHALLVHTGAKKDKPFVVITWSTETEDKLPDNIRKVNLLADL